MSSEELEEYKRIINKKDKVDSCPPSPVREDTLGDTTDAGKHIHTGQWTLSLGQWTVDTFTWTVDTFTRSVDSGHFHVDSRHFQSVSGQWTLSRGQ